MANIIEAFVAFDTSKLRNAVAIAEAGRAGEVRFLGEIENTEAAVAKLVTSSAVMRTGSGSARPSTLAVLKLIVSRNLVSSWVGRLAGDSPLRMRST
jgi:hypothetical protein